MSFWIINVIMVFFLGCFYGLSELIARYNDSKYIFRVLHSYIYVLFNGIISVVAFFLIKHFKSQDINLINTVEISNLIIAGLGGMMILRSSFFSIKYKNSKIDIGFGTIVQIFLDLIEKKMKNNAASIKIKEIHEIMKGVSFDDAKYELSTICINSIDNFSSDDNEILIKKIEQISSLNISNTNKVIQLGINISQYCDNKILKNSIEVLGLNKNSSNDHSEVVSDINDIDFYLKKLK